METAVERLAALALLLVGLSHVIAPAAWAKLFERMRESPDTAGLANAMVNLPLGLMIVAFHQLWTWPAVIVTVLGWALLFKSALHILFPWLALRSLAMAGEGEAAIRRYRLAGAVMLLLALLVGWIALR